MSSSRLRRQILPLAFAAALLVSSQASGSGPARGRDRFDRADSLALIGRFGGARQELLQQLGSPGHPDPEALFRLFGIYHGCGREVDFTVLLDSLEEAGFDSLRGYRISALDLAGDPGAASLCGPDEVLLKAFLEGTPREWLDPGTVLPRPASLAERYERVVLTPPGELSPEQLKTALDDCRLLPSLAPRLLAELQPGILSGGKDWDEALETLAGLGVEGASVMRARRMLATRSFDEDWLAGCLDSATAVSSVAAAALAFSSPGTWGESWKIADALAEGGDTWTLRSLISASGDPVFRSGAGMALARASGTPSELLSMTTAVPEGSPDSLRARAALFEARALRDLDRGDESREAYLHFASVYPWHPVAAESARLTALALDGDMAWEAAADAYLLSLSCSGDFEADETAYWRGGFCSLMAGRIRTADSLLSAGCEAFPGGYWEDEMLFWRARCSALLGAGARADDLLRRVAESHPWEFYGMLAASRLVGDQPTSEDIWRVQPTRIPAVAMELLSCGYGRLAVEVLSSGREPGRPEGAAALALMGEHRKAMEVLTALDGDLRYGSGRILPDSLVPFYFAAPYMELALQEAPGLSFDASILMGSSVKRARSTGSRARRSERGD